jgi:Cu2+-exporting ATPase
MGNITAILDVDGARCASCSYTIERLGRKVPGVEEVRVHPDSQEIHVTYGGDPAALAEIVRIVGRLGYEARPRAASGA